MATEITFKPGRKPMTEKEKQKAAEKKKKQLEKNLVTAVPDDLLPRSLREAKQAAEAAEKKRRKARRAQKTARQVEQEQVDNMMDTIAERCSYYRANPQRFASDYLKINLKWFQVIILWVMFHCNYVMYLAARGQGKSFLLAIYCVIKCILYPGTVIAVASKTRKQGAEILEKIQTILIPTSPYLKAEIENFVFNVTEGEIFFRNTSDIKLVTANENARHNRANIVLIDEYRMVDPVTINTVLRKFLTVERHPGFLDKPEYAGYPREPNGELYASSCWYESSWAFEKARAYCVNMVRGRDYFICSLPYQVSIMCDLLSRAQVENEMSESDFSELSFRMESEALWISSGEDSLYKFEDLDKCRKLKFPWLPHNRSELVSDSRVKIPPKANGEKRILSVDIALMASTKHDNDAASIFVNSLTPMAVTNSTDKYINNIVYTENIEGVRSDALALRVRQLYEEYNIDYIAIDTRGNGLPIVDLLMADIYDKETGLTYPALDCCNNDEISARCAVRGAPKVIWSIIASEAFNSQAALLLRESFRNGTVRLLQSDYDCRDELAQLKNYSKLSPVMRNEFQMPYIHTTLLVNELVNLRVEQKSGSTVRVKERSGMRKDRYSSLSYNIFVSKELEREMQKPRNDMSTMADMISFRRPILK